MHGKRNAWPFADNTKLAMLSDYQAAQTELACEGRNPLAQRILRENPFRIFPPGYFTGKLAENPPVDPRAAPTPLNAIIREYGGDGIICRSEALQLSFAWCLIDVMENYARQKDLSEARAKTLLHAFRMWWGITVMNGDDTTTYPPGSGLFDFWQYLAQNHALNYLNLCLTTGKHGRLEPERPDDWQQRFTDKTWPMLRMAYGERLPAEEFL